MEDKEKLYSMNTEFNQYIDDQHSVSILGNEFLASQVLYTMDSIAYKEAIEEYKVSQFQDDIDVICSEFPSHIAVNFAKLFQASAYIGAREKLGYLIDCSESLINYLFMLAICELKFNNESINEIEYRSSDDPVNPNLRRIKAKDLFTDTIKLKLRILEAFIESGKFESYPSYFVELKIEVIHNLIDLNQIRNDISHSGTLSNEQYDKMFQKGYTVLSDVMHNVLFLRECKVLQFMKIEKLKVVCTIFEGTSSIIKMVDYELRKEDISKVLEFDDEKVLFVKWHDKFIKMTPYLQIINESQGHDKILCGFKRLESGELVFEHSKTKNEMKFESNSDFLKKEREEVSKFLRET